MQSTSQQTPQPIRKKSRTALIVTLVGIFVITPLVLAVVSLSLAPSMKLCSGLVRTGNEVSSLYDKDVELATYNYHCLGGTPPTAQDQYISLGFVSEARYETRNAFELAMTSELEQNGWSRTTPSVGSSESEPVMYSKDGYSAVITATTYQPAHGKITIKPADTRTRIGFVFEKQPTVPKALTAEQEMKFITVPVLVPEYVPEGYDAWSTNSRRSTGDTAIIVLEGGKGTVTPRLTISVMPTDYDIATNRELLVTTANGIAIYGSAQGASQRRITTVAIVGSHLVTLESALGHPNVDPQLTIDQVSQIYGSLQQTNTPAK